MPRAKPKRDANSGYWIPAFTLGEIERQAISQSLRKPPSPEFFDALENATGRFIGWSNYLRSAPTRANMRAALLDLDRKTRELTDALDGIDAITRQMISQACLLEGLPRETLNNSQNALLDLLAAILGTKAALEDRGRKRGKRRPPGGFVDPKQAYISALFNIFLQFRLKPSVTFNGPFEACIQILLDAAKEKTGTSNIHRLAQLAAQRHKV